VLSVLNLLSLKLRLVTIINLLTWLWCTVSKEECNKQTRKPRIKSVYAFPQEREGGRQTDRETETEICLIVLKLKHLICIRKAEFWPQYLLS
jgi:hypothetical protein